VVGCLSGIANLVAGFQAVGFYFVRIGPTIRAPTFALLITDASGSGALAIYLFVLGILLLGSTAVTPRMLRIYAWVKIPLACLAGVAWPLMIYELDLSSGGVDDSIILLCFIWGAIIAVLGCAFPIGLLVALRRRTIRAFFSSSRE
jgi:hypothetical protein